MKKSLAVLAITGAVMVPAQAEAAFINEWAYTVDTVWTSSNFDSEPGGTVITTPLELSWGPGTDFTNNNLPFQQGRSALVISNSPAVGTIETNGSADETNTITHYNNPIPGNSRSLIDATLSTTLTLQPVDPLRPPVPFGTLNFDVNFTETTNSAPCGFASQSVCDDIFVVSFEDIAQQFMYEDVLYTLFITETTGNLGPLSDAQCAAADDEENCIGLLTRERFNTPVTFDIRIEAEEPPSVPEPTTLALFGLGLLGAGYARRRRS